DDGPSAMASIDWGDLVTVQSTEVIETRMPLLVESSRLCLDSGGAGASRGGLSMQRALRVLVGGGRYSLLSDGALLPAFGVLGGRSGVPVGAWIDREGTIERFDTPGKVAGHAVEQGSDIVIRSAGGGGYGDPLERDAGHAAPLRAWIRISEAVRAGTLPIDARGLAMLKIAAGRPLAVRPLHRRMK